MTGAFEGSPRVISAEQRRELQRRFEQARQASLRNPPDFRRAHALVSENLRTDPGNILYIDLLLANLRRRDVSQPRQGWWSGLVRRSPLSARAAMQRALAARNWPRTVQTALEAAWEEGLTREVLGALADAAAAEEHLPAELRYRMAAVDLYPDETEPLREMARALERGGRFDDARDWWRRLAERMGDDAEARERLAKYASGTAGESDRSPENAAVPDIDRLLTEAQQAIEARQFDVAERLLKLASGAGGGDLRIREAWEELSLRQSEHRLALAREQTAADPTSEGANRLVAQLTEEHGRLWLGILHSRSERFPQDKALRLELARQLKRMGNYSGAIQRLEEIREAAETRSAALVELGECWQHLRQFAKALDFYSQAIAVAAEDHETDRRHLALYRGAVLAEALGQPATASGWLEQLVAEAGPFKDAAERLDKLRRICDKNGFPAGG